MRATAMSMFFSVPRCTASWMVRSTRPPGVAKIVLRGAVGSCPCGWVCVCAWAMSALTCSFDGSCADEGTAAVAASAAAVQNVAVFLTKCLQGVCWLIRLARALRLPPAVGVPAALGVAFVDERLQLGALIGAEEQVDPVEHDCARLAHFASQAFDLVHVLRDGRDV